MHLCTHMVRVWALLFVNVLRALSCAHSERVWVRARACVFFLLSLLHHDFYFTRQETHD